ncbi:hypothetical protein IM793_21885 [Pedobacter sp. MR2016-19]|uniref:hypothetical protein n=1 Tax=Pedobacter sp. MR2016-19 TaxID=2780089 RepID=UPI001874733F|nr:hypothetical protein [Pedobacter sp. MR2016-19]MBE5321824.1 hypothetical protein [Pedobacter sp. MR2016-19]
MKYLLSILILFAGFVVRAQVKVENDQLFGKDCFYMQSLPVGAKITGVLFLVPGFLESPTAVTAQSSIVQEANKNGLAVVMVNLTPNNESFPIDKKSLNTLGKMIKEFYHKNKLQPALALYLGGFSIGGTTALKFYAEKNKELKISKVFAIDPPLDMVRLRKSLLKGREKSFVTKLDTLNTEHKIPEQSLKEQSVYNPDYTELSMLPDYQLTALRIYSEPDILWWINNRSMDLSDMNVTDCAGYINKLKQKSEENKVELILTKDRGIRNNKQKHPHSWSIAEPTDLIAWLIAK